MTATVFDADGFYRTGDVMAEIAPPDHLVYLDRRNNVLKLSQGEFVAIAHLEAVYSAAPGVRQIFFVYGNSERPPNLLAVVVPPTDEALQRYGNGETLRTQLHRALQDTAKATQLQSYEIPPTDFLIETTPFTAANGLLSGVGKLLRPQPQSSLRGPPRNPVHRPRRRPSRTPAESAPRRPRPPRHRHPARRRTHHPRRPGPTRMRTSPTSAAIPCPRSH